MGMKTKDAESVIRCKDCQFFEPDSITKDGEIVFRGANGMCHAWNGCKSNEDGYCHLGALKETKMTIDRALEIFLHEILVVAGKNLEEWKKARILIADFARKYQKMMQIKKDMMYDIYMAGVNLDGEFHGCYVRFKDIENIVNRYFQRAEDVDDEGGN